MLYILYQDSNGENRFDTITQTYDPGLDDKWRSQHPGCTLIAIHDADKDLTANEHQRRMNFNINCGAYGFRPGDYRAKIKLDAYGVGVIGELVGFNPRNRKYPCLIQPLKPGQKGIKATPDYVRRSLCDAQQQP